MSETKSITLLGNATKILAEVQTIDDAKQLMDLAASAKLYARKHNLGKEAVNYAHEIETDAEIKLGEILIQTEKNKGGNPKLQPISTVDRLTTLSELGITLHLSKDSQDLARLPNDEKDKVRKGTQSKKKAISKNKKIKDTDTIIEQGKTFINTDQIKLLEGDYFERIKDVPDSSIDLLCTDPPYLIMEDYEWDNKELSFLNDWLDVLVPKLKDKYIGFIFCDARMMFEFEKIITDYFAIKNRLIWI
jgi:hypothetical protein